MNKIPEDFKLTNAIVYARVTDEGLKNQNHIHTRHQKAMYGRGFTEHYNSEGNYFSRRNGDVLMVGQEASKDRPDFLKFRVFFQRGMAGQKWAEAKTERELQNLKDLLDVPTLELSDEIQSNLQRRIAL
jgi:hypothetical protein